jgi:hypothetical protein
MRPKVLCECARCVRWRAVDRVVGFSAVFVTGVAIYGLWWLLTEGLK